MRCLDYNRECIFKTHVHFFLRRGGKFLSRPDLFTQVVTNNWLGSILSVPELLSKSSEPLLLDDLSSMQRCILGIVCHVDNGFCTRVKEEIISYRSSTSLDRATLAENLFEASLGIASIVNLFHTLFVIDRYIFALYLCGTGSVSMLKPFLDSGFNFKCGFRWSSLLGNAAAKGNTDTVHMLLRAGANGAHAIRYFLNCSTNLSDLVFKHILGILVDNSLPFSLKVFITTHSEES